MQLLKIISRERMEKNKSKVHKTMTPSLMSALMLDLFDVLTVKHYGIPHSKGKFYFSHLLTHFVFQLPVLLLGVSLEDRWEAHVRHMVIVVDSMFIVNH